jgi:hypothetical protein
MKSLTEQILDLKTEAKNQRDRGIKGYDRALTRLNTAIGLATKGLTTTSVTDAVRQLTKELADCHGMVGGIERRWGIEGRDVERLGHLAASCIAYDEGYRHEWDEKYGTPATYNLVNRLISRLLIDPKLLEIDKVVDLGNSVEPINVKCELVDAMKRIDERLANKGNFWAEADLALLRVLTGRADAATAYAPFFALSPPDYAFGSALDALRPLADALRPLASANLAAASSPQAAVGLLTSKRPRS